MTSLHQDSIILQRRLKNELRLYQYSIYYYLEMGNSLDESNTRTQVRINHQHIHNPMLVCEDNKQYLKISCGVEELEYQKWSKNLNVYKQLKIQYILLPAKSSFTLTGICSSIGTAQIFYEHFRYLLTNEIYFRRERGSIFQETQIWLLLLKLIKAEREAQKIGSWLGDVRPDNIFLDNQGQIKIASQSSWPQATNAFERGIQKLPAYISPQNMTKLKEGNIQSLNKQASQMFSVGLTLLSLANLTDQQVLYNMKQYFFNFQLLKNSLLQLKRNCSYSQILRSTILNLCSLENLRRMKIDQLQQFLLKHQSQIINKKSFIIDNAPQKLNKQFQQLRVFINDNLPLFDHNNFLSQDGGSGITFPQHLDVHKVKPEYLFDKKTTIIKFLE